MCGLCGLIGGVHWSEVHNQGEVFGRAAMTPRAEMDHRMRWLNRMVAPAKVRIRNTGNSGYTVTTATGKSATANSLPEIWVAVERLLGAKVDPLDPGYLESLERGEGAA